MKEKERCIMFTKWDIFVNTKIHYAKEQIDNEIIFIVVDFFFRKYPKLLHPPYSCIYLKAIFRCFILYSLNLILDTFSLVGLYRAKKKQEKKYSYIYICLFLPYVGHQEETNKITTHRSKLILL